MLLIEALQIKKYYGDRQIIALEHLQIHTGDKIGIIGRNGSGKTTLLNMLSGILEPDEGRIKRYVPIAYIRQFSEEQADTSAKALKEFRVTEAAKRSVQSGGEHTRIKLANALNRCSVLLFADEPTANLDIEGIDLFLKKLSDYDTFLLISHDRALLDGCCNSILEIENGCISSYPGNFSAYTAQKQEQRNRTQGEYVQYIQKKTDLEDALRDRSQRAKSMKKAPSRMGNSEARLHKRKAGEKAEKLHNASRSIQSRLDKLDAKEKPREAPGVFLDFSLTNPPANKVLISVSGFSFEYGSKALFSGASFEIPAGRKTALIGENGSGKTTLLQCIVQGHAGFTLAPKAVIGYFKQDLSDLLLDQSALLNVMRDSVQSETTARTILARLGIQGDAVFKAARVLSGGERIKVSFAKLMVSKANVLILDEPTNYLDIASIEALQALLKDYAGTILYVSHDRSFIDNTADRLLIIQDRKLISYEGTLSAYESDQARRQGPDDTRTQLLKMRMADVISKMGLPKADKTTLEKQYQDILQELKGQTN